MCNKYEIINEGGRKRVRALRSFTVQGRDVCFNDLGGYVYDEKTLSQEGNCWIFSGSLEYPGVHVMDGAIVDMGNDTAKVAPRMKACTIRGNSRIMGAVSFESASTNALQTPAMFEQGGYSAMVGMIPVKASDGSRIRIPASVFGGSVGAVAITSAAHEARIISLDSDGIVTDGGTWTAGGAAVTLTTTSPYFLVEVRKTPSAAITPADVTAAGITLTSAREGSLDINNSAIVPVYNGVPTTTSNIMRMISLSKGSMFNCYLRADCTFNQANPLYYESTAVKTNFEISMGEGTQFVIRGFRLVNTNFYSRSPVPTGGGGGKVIFDVSDCSAFSYDTETFPVVADFQSAGKTFYFRNCNMPVGSAIHYYDPKVNVWDNIDFTKAMADLGKTAFANTTIVSSNVQGMYRARGNTSGVIGGLLEAASSFDGATYSGVPGGTYDSVIYKDCVIKGKFTIIGRNVFGGTLGGASKITNTTETAMVIDGNFRIEGNASVTDTPLKGTGYIGDNAELKNGNVEGYIYMQDDAKYIPEKAAFPAMIAFLVMMQNAKITVQTDLAGKYLKCIMTDNSLISGAVSTQEGFLYMYNDAQITSANNPAVSIRGALAMKDKAKITRGMLTVQGNAELIGAFNLENGNQTVYGNRTLSDVSQIGETELPPMKQTW